VREGDRAKHDLFRKLLGFGFDHHHRVLRGRDDEVERAGLAFVEARVELVLAVLVADARRADRPMKGTPEMVSAADAATIATMSGSFTPS
jgi:hypothetical protein